MDCKLFLFIVSFLAGSGAVDMRDLGMLVLHWAEKDCGRCGASQFGALVRLGDYWLQEGSGSPADLFVDPDNEVNWLDLQVFVDYWLCYCPPDWPLK